MAERDVQRIGVQQKKTNSLEIEMNCRRLNCKLSGLTAEGFDASEIARAEGDRQKAADSVEKIGFPKLPEYWSVKMPFWHWHVKYAPKTPVQKCL